jgi:chemotaxis protein methyltransferase CheR
MNSTPELTERDFQIFRELVYRHTGIHLHEGKRQLVKTRLSKRLRQGGFPSFRHYYEHLVMDRTGEELSRFLDAITTNLTGFFREPAHFDFLKEELYPKIRREVEHRIRPASIVFWSAGCSTGEEPYSLAIHAMDHLGDLPGLQLAVHATDISQEAIRKAAKGIYPLSRVRSLKGRGLRRGSYGSNPI